MVQENDPDFLTTTRYKFPHYNEWWQCERRAAHEPLVNYFQKIQQTDTLTLIFHSNNGGTSGANMKVYDMDWNDMGVAMGVSDLTVSGFEITSDVTNTTYTATTHKVYQVIAAMGLPDGKYFFVMEVPYSSGDPVRYVSEPFFLRDQHEKTKLLEYTNTANNFDVFFVTHSINFQLRVESHLYNLTPNSIDTTFEDELVDITLLDSVPYNTYTWAVKAVPEWMINKVNRAWSCDRVRWEGKYFTKDKDAKWEYTGTANEPLKGMSISVRLAKNRYSQQYSYADPILVYTILNNGDSGGASRFPYFLHKATLNRTGSTPINILTDINGSNTIGAYTTNCLEVRDATDEQLLLDYANLDRKPYHGQLGSYYMTTNVGGDLSMYYQPHSSEQNYTTSSWRVLSRRMIIRFLGTWGTGQYYDVRGSYIGYGLVRQNGSHASAAYGNGNPSITYLVGGSSINIINNIARLYHYDQDAAAETVDVFHAIYPLQTPNISEVGGTYPANLVSFTLTSGTSATVVDWINYVPCAASIFAISYYGNAINLVQGMDTHMSGQLLTSIQEYDLSKNAMSSGMVDNVFNQMYNTGGGNETFTTTNGEMYTDLQTPSAPPTGASNTARTFIGTTKSWVIGTD